MPPNSYARGRVMLTKYPAAFPVGQLVSQILTKYTLRYPECGLTCGSDAPASAADSFTAAFRIFLYFGRAFRRPLSAACQVCLSSTLRQDGGHAVPVGCGHIEQGGLALPIVELTEEREGAIKEEKLITLQLGEHIKIYQIDHLIVLHLRIILIKQIIEACQVQGVQLLLVVGERNKDNLSFKVDGIWLWRWILLRLRGNL